MPTESQVVTWLTNNWPTVVVALSAGTIYVAAYLRLHAFLAIVASQTKQLAALRQRVRIQREILEALIANHCNKYPLETKEMLVLLAKDREHDDDVS